MARTDNLWDDEFRISILSGALRWYSHLYYRGSPDVTDGNYDLLFKELQRLEKKIGHVRHDSPTQKPLS